MQGQVFPQRKFFDRIKKTLAPLGIGLMAALKFAPILFKTGGSMFVTVLIYAPFFGWRYAVGVVLLIFVHEAGHLIAARMMGLAAGWPVFIPFMGAIIALKEAPRNAWVEAVVGIGGPILGSIGALATWYLYIATGHVLFLALIGFMINLFNLIPIVPMDGGRIVAALSPWLWLLGLVVLVPVLLLSRNFLLIFILFLLLMNGLPRVMSLFRGRTDEERRYLECTPWQRWLIGILYFALLAGLGLMMYHTDVVADPTFPAWIFTQGREVELIRNPIIASSSSKPRIELRVDRLTLAKRRWRAEAEDGAEFGFVLERPIKDGATFFETEAGVYSISQQPEDLYEIAPTDATHAARIGWMIGNLHFPIAIEKDVVRAPADPAVRLLLEREHVHFAEVRKVFHPLKVAAGLHHHHHEH